MTKIETKKSAVDLAELAIGIVVLGVIVSVGATILHNYSTGQITNAGTGTVLGESVTPTDAGATLAGTWFQGITTVTNTTGTPITSPNYSVSVNPDTGVATLTNLTSEFPTAWEVNYTVYNTSDPRYSIADSGAAGLGEYGNWFAILVIVGIAAVIIALILASFRKQSSWGMGAY